MSGLAQRVITALVLLALLVPALLAEAAWPFNLITLLMIGAAGWEWGRLNQAGAPLAWGIGLAVMAACGVALTAGWASAAPQWVWWLAVVLWLLGTMLALRSGPTGWPRVARPLRWLLGGLALWAAWLAMAQARQLGLNFIMSVFCLVWMADIAAYFSGRRFGRRKLAPSISPGKSWEGVYGGVIGVLLLALLWSQLEAGMAPQSASLFTQLGAALGWTGAALALVLLAGTGVIGDLMESLVKRAAGAKDSSRLLPGHGGVLDRIDALLPVFPLAMALIGL
ncbi:MAG: phosphatidate cytidylyltransferase [Rubrivivax sp.]